MLHVSAHFGHLQATSLQLKSPARQSLSVTVIAKEPLPEDGGVGQNM
jgi:hypothetical protein